MTVPTYRTDAAIRKSITPNKAILWQS